MIRRGMPVVLFLAILAAVPGCNVKLDDALGAKPFPMIIGGDDTNVFYATNLGDIPLEVLGATYDSVMPGLVGPSNLYRFSEKKSELIRSLAPTAPSMWRNTLASDGRHFAYVLATSLEELLTSTGGAVVVEDLAWFGPFDPRTLFESGESDTWSRIDDLVLDSGRVAYAIVDSTNSVSQIRVQDALGGELMYEIEVEGNLWSLALRGNFLAYAGTVPTGTVGGRRHVVLRNLPMEEVVVLADDIDLMSDVFLTQNSVIWSEVGSSLETARVYVYDIPSEMLSVWADDVQGDLVGATDEFLLTEEEISRDLPFIPSDGEDMIVVRRYDRDGEVRKLAEFRWTGKSGQAQVIGNRAAWVNPQREIVLQPLAGGDRIKIKPI